MLASAHSAAWGERGGTLLHGATREGWGLAAQRGGGRGLAASVWWGVPRHTGRETDVSGEGYAPLYLMSLYKNLILLLLRKISSVFACCRGNINPLSLPISQDKLFPFSK